MTYFREAVVNTQELLDLLVKCENKVRNGCGQSLVGVCCNIYRTSLLHCCISNELFSL